jgi:hypothetical protein
MNYFKEGIEHPAIENTVYRVFGGDVEMEGGYVTDCLPENANPIQMREDLALSQDSFYNEEGEIVRNLACNVAEGTIYTTEDYEIINLDGQTTGEYLVWETVEPVGQLEGGANEFKLSGDFNDLVEIESVEELRHESTPGWDAYIEAESEVLEQIEEDS